MKYLSLILPFLFFASCTSKPKEPEGPAGPVMIAKKKKRMPKKSCFELYELLYEMDDFHGAARALCIRNALDRCGENDDCSISKITLCQQKYFSDMLSYMKRFRKRKCWREITLNPDPQST